MYNMQIRPENTCWVWCDCDSHLMKPPGLAASIWSRLPSYNTSLATGALRASLITDNEWKENPETEGERLLEGRKRGNGGWEREKEAPAVLTSAASLNSKTLTAVPTGIVLACVLNMRAARKLHIHQKWKKTNKQIFYRFTARRSEVKSTAYPSQNVSSQWRPRWLVKQAQGDEDHLRAAGHRVKAKTGRLRKRWHA